MKKIIITFLFSFIFTSLVATALEEKDAMLRDEDISALSIDVKYFIRSDGLYEYVYTLKSPQSNKGVVDRYILDLGCDNTFEPVDLPYATGDPGYFGGVEFSVPKHTPAAIWANEGFFAISENNNALWSISTEPGRETTDLRLISATAPGLRRYKIIPSVDYVYGNWKFPEDYYSIPQDEDFAVIGLVAGPGCPGVTEPPTETYLYPGDSHRSQSETINDLLTYATPQRSRFHVDKGTKETTIHIYYSEDIDKRTFKVQPGWMQRYFNPIAGSNEEVFIPLRKKRTKISLSVHTKKGTENGKTRPKRKAFESDFSYKDHDEFEIRVD